MSCSQHCWQLIRKKLGAWNRNVTLENKTLKEFDKKRKILKESRQRSFLNARVCQVSRIRHSSAMTSFFEVAPLTWASFLYSGWRNSGSHIPATGTLASTARSAPFSSIWVRWALGSYLRAELALNKKDVVLWYASLPFFYARYLNGLRADTYHGYFSLHLLISLKCSPWPGGIFLSETPLKNVGCSPRYNGPAASKCANSKRDASVSTLDQRT